MSHSLNPIIEEKVKEPASVLTTDTNTKLGHMKSIFERQNAAHLEQPFPAYEQRRQWLSALEKLIRDNVAEIQTAINSDFGYRSEDETLLTEIMGILKSISYARSHLRTWMKPRKKSVDINFKPATARIMPQPLGVVGVMAPWNFPIGLVIKPLVSALAAGNRVMIKPSELTSEVSSLLGRLLSKIFDEDQVCVIEGDAEVAAAFCELPFNHLLFTGSTHTGKQVMAAAAKNLTPLTLELGGKSPVIIDDSIDMKRAVKTIVTGKILNCGQTCTAPDYVLVSEQRVNEFVDTFSTLITTMYPNPINNPDYTSIINDRHYARLQNYIDDATNKGSQKVELYPELNSNVETRKLLPALIMDPTEDSNIMQEEIFGPLLIVKPYKQLKEAVSFINRKSRPLALYLFTDDSSVENFVLTNTIAGGVTINDTLLHYTQESLPFGGVGHSGFGAYHGESGFETFSHMKPIFRQSRMNALDLLRAPYNKTSKWLLKNIIRMA